MNGTCGKGMQGFALVGAIFVLLVLALLGAVAVQVSGVQNSTPLLALQGAQAYHAARSGLEWGIRQAVVANACGTFAAPAGTTFIIEGLSVSVSCSVQAATEGGIPLSIFRIAARAENGTFGTRPDYVCRRLEATVASSPP